jgi:hypothetical protein
MSQHIPLAVVVILLSMLPSTAEIGIKNSWLYFDSNSSSKENVSVAFQLERHVISNGEKWEGVISKGDGIDVMAGRKASVGPAAAFDQDITIANVIHTKASLKTMPPKLHFVVFGSLSIQIGDSNAVNCTGFRMGTNDHIRTASLGPIETYDWWMGSSKCVTVPTTGTMNCICSQGEAQLPSQVAFHAKDGSHRIYVAILY